MTRRGAIDDGDLYAFPLADHWVVLRPGSDKLGLLNGSAWEVLDAVRRGISAEEIGGTWMRRYGLPAAEALSAAQSALTNLHGIGLLGAVAGGRTAAPRAITRAPRTCDGEAPPPLELRIGLHPFKLRFADIEIQDCLEGRVRHLQADAPSTGPRLEVLRDERGYVITREGFVVSRIPDLDALALELAYHVNEVAQHDDTQLCVLHAGAVSHHGRALAIAGISGKGKSTLTAYLACHGYDYLADDMLPIDEGSLLAEPVPGCIGLKEPAWPVVAAFRPDLDAAPILQGTQKRMRLLPPRRPSRPEVWRSRHEIAALVFVEFSRDSAATLARMAAPQAMQALIDSQAYFARPLRPTRMEKLVRWIEHLPAYQLRYGSLAEVPELLGPLLRN